MKKQQQQKRKKVSAEDDLKNRSSSGFNRAYRLPEGANTFRIDKAGRFRINIIPFKMGKKHPRVLAGKQEVGDLTWFLPFFVHRDVGPDRLVYLCPRKTFEGDGKKHKCFVCDFRAKIMEEPDGDEDLAKALKPKERDMYNIVDMDNQSDGVQIMECSRFGFRDNLFDYIEGKDNPEEFKFFGDIEDGKEIKIHSKKEKIGASPFYNLLVNEMVDRKKPLSEDLIDAAACLDECLISPSYEEVRNEFGQEAEEDEDEEEDTEEEEEEDEEDTEEEDEEEEDEPKPKKGKKIAKKSSKIKLGAWVEHEDFGVCSVVGISDDGTSIKVEDSDGKLHKGIDPDDLQPADAPDEEEEEEEETPKKGKKKSEKARSKKPVKDEEEDEDDDVPFDEDEDEEDEEEEDDDEAEEDDEEEEEEDDEEEEEKTPRKKKKK